MRQYKLISQMIKRIVRLSFEKDKVDIFRSVFDKSKSKIRSFPGCIHLELLREVSKENIFFTLSIWSNQEALEEYRNSELFKTTWKETKKLFNGKPQAWSLELLEIPEYE